MRKENRTMWTLLYRDLWAPIWPNWAATLPVLAWHHRRIRTHINAAVAEVAARPGEGAK